MMDPKTIADNIQRGTAALAAFRVLEVVPKSEIETTPSGYVVKLLGATGTDRDLSAAIIKAATAAGVEIPKQPNPIKLTNKPQGALKAGD